MTDFGEGIVTVVTLIICTIISGCAQTKNYTPRPAAATYELPGLSSSTIDIQVNDLRADANQNEGLRNVLKAQLLTSLSSQAVHQPTKRYTLVVDIIEHRSFFTLGNWNASTRLRVSLRDASGSVLGQWDATGTAHRSNMWGYASAKAVSQDSYDIAVADMMSTLSQVSVR